MEPLQFNLPVGVIHVKNSRIWNTNSGSATKLSGPASSSAVWSTGAQVSSLLPRCGLAITLRRVKYMYQIMCGMLCTIPRFVQISTVAHVVWLQMSLPSPGGDTALSLLGSYIYAGMQEQWVVAETYGPVIRSE